MSDLNSGKVIRRFNISADSENVWDYKTIQHEDGDWIRYDDHVKAMSELIQHNLDMATQLGINPYQYSPQATLPEVFDTKAVEVAAREFCKDWPTGVYHPNDLTTFFEKGAQWMFERLNKGKKSDGTA